RPVCRRLEVVCGHQPACLFLQHIKAGMRIGAVKFTARCKHGCNDACPNPHIRQPTQGSPSRKDKIERARCQLGSRIHRSLNKVGRRSGLLGKAARNLQRGPGEIEPGRHRATPHQAECVPADMALQMEDALSVDVAELDRFDRVERVLARTKAVQHVIASGVACVKGGALIPILAIDFERISHAKPRNCGYASKHDRLYLYQLLLAAKVSEMAVPGAAASTAPTERMSAFHV